MGFTKLDEGILQSSIMAAHPVTFKVWVALMAACRPNGVAPVSPSYIGSICRLTAKEVTRALDELAAPDPNSRSLDEDGRRIIRVDGGFRLVTYLKRRDEAIKAAESAGRVDRRRRAREGDVRTGSGHVPDPSASAVSVSASAGEGGAGGGGEAFYRRRPRIEQEPEAREFFDAMRLRASGMLPPRIHGTWWRPMNGWRLAAGELLLAAPTRQFVEYFQEATHQAQLARMAAELGQPSLRFAFLIVEPQLAGSAA